MGSRLLKYKNYFLSGEWHVHTNYTDGDNTIDENCQEALKLKIPLIAFTEHVRMITDYDFNKFIDSIEAARERYAPLIILAGCEAKVLDLTGKLNVADDVLSKCDIVLGAFHSFPYDDKTSCLIAVKNMLNKKQVDVWAHPVSFLQRNGMSLSDDEYKEISMSCSKNNVLIELNLKYDSFDNRFIEIARLMNNDFVIGSDVHTIGDFLRRK